MYLMDGFSKICARRACSFRATFFLSKKDLHFFFIQNERLRLCTVERLLIGKFELILVQLHLEIVTDSKFREGDLKNDVKPVNTECRP